MLERVNPELVKKAAELAIPGCTFFIGGLGVFREDWPPASERIYFNPLTSDADAMKLERALKDEKNGHWSFGKECEHNDFPARYWAYSNAKDVHLWNQQDATLFLECVSSQFSIPLYLEAP